MEQRCRCQYLNVVSGDMAHDYARLHLEFRRTDGMGRTVLRCPEHAIEWIEERQAVGYGNDVAVLRRATR